MGQIKLLVTRGVVIGVDEYAVEGEVIEVDTDTARNLMQAGAAVKAEDDAKVGKPKATKESKTKADN